MKVPTSIPRSIIRSTNQTRKNTKNPELKLSKQVDKQNGKAKNQSKKERKRERKKYPKMTAFHSMMLLSWGAPLMPAGGSCWSLLKSLINLFLAGVDMIVTTLKLQRYAYTERVRRGRSEERPKRWCLETHRGFWDFLCASTGQAHPPPVSI